jgi:hypothetical protein
LNPAVDWVVVSIGKVVLLGLVAPIPNPVPPLVTAVLTTTPDELVVIVPVAGVVELNWMENGIVVLAGSPDPPLTMVKLVTTPAREFP